MRRFAILCLLLVNEADGLWSVSGNDSSRSHLSLHVENMTCNNDVTHCQSCFTAREGGKVHLMMFDYVENPYRLLEYCPTGTHYWKVEIMQELQSDWFRLCAEYAVTEAEGKLTICLDNDFEEVTLPPECAQPIAVQTLDLHVADEEVRGFQALLCTPQKPRPLEHTLI